LKAIRAIAGLLPEVKVKKPLVHHITNYVTVNDCANIVLALGGSPVMADDEAEVAEMVTIASSLVLNIGTLNSRTIRSMVIAGKKANELGIPVVLDPVGAGATSFRNNTAAMLIQEIQLAVLRGNMSEIKKLAGLTTQTRGVDSFEETAGGQEIAQRLAKKHHCIVAITGAQDIIADGSRTAFITNGDPLLTKVTGTGCMATSLIGCYCGVTRDYYLATGAAIITMGLAGEKAVTSLESDEGIGSFKVHLLDWISKMTAEDLLKGGRFHE
jgi:hydroxyethylthiazole kinase